MELSLRILGLCVALAGAEMLHGIARTLFLLPRVGKERAQQVGIVTGSLLAFAVCYLVVPSLGLSTLPQLLSLGLFLSAFMASFDVAVARLAMRRPWRSVAGDFDPRNGNYLVFGLALLLFFPWLAVALRTMGSGL